MYGRFQASYFPVYPLLLKLALSAKIMHIFYKYCAITVRAVLAQWGAGTKRRARLRVRQLADETGAEEQRCEAQNGH